MAKAPDPKKLREDAAAAAARSRVEAFNAFQVKVHVDDRVYAFAAEDVGALDVAALRDATGSTLIDPVLNMLQYFSPESQVVALDKIAELVFLARRQAGEDCSFLEVAASITARNAVWCEFPTGEMPAPEEAMFLDPPVSDGG